MTADVVGRSRLCLGLAAWLSTCHVSHPAEATVSTAISIEVVTLIFFSHSASSEAQILDTVSDEAQ
eukprot:COSAG01_NODE_13048_length_1644_cov_2.577346_3_plen_65_part_01